MNRFKTLAGSVIILSILCFAKHTSAQTPKMLDYQSVIRDNNGKLLANTPLTIRFSLIQTDPGGAIEYTEDHSVTTNQFGLVYVYIGNGTPVFGSFLLVDWSKSPKYLKVEIDIAGNQAFTDIGTVQLVSVPFALYAEKSGSGLAAGNGIQIINDSIYNTGDLNNSNELQTLSVSASGKGILLSDGGGNIEFDGTGGASISLAGNTLLINSETYAAGTGIVLNGNTFSVLSSSSLWNASKIQGYNVDTLKPQTNQVLEWNGSAWSPAADDNNTYLAGTGITLTGNVFSNAGDLSSANELQTISASGNTSPAIDLSLSGGSITFTGTGGTSLSRSANNINISSFIYDAGTGISLSGNVFSHPAHTGDVSGITSLTVNAIQGRVISSSAPANSQVLKWNGSAWSPATDDNNTYSAGTGISLAGNVFSHPAHTGDVSGITSLTVNAIQGRAISSTAPANSQILKWNGSAWSPASDDNNTYSAGTGISLTGTVFSNAGDLSSANELQTISASGTTSPAIDLSLSGGSITFTASGGVGLSRSANNINISSLTYDAGTGISISGNTFSHATHTGDVTGITSLTVNAIQGRAISSSAPANSQVLKWNGSAWSPAADDNNTYSAGTGISLTGTVFSNAGDLSSANELQTISASGTTSPAIDLSLSGGSITFSASGGVGLSRSSNNINISSLTYDAGVGISLSGNTFSHATHTGDVTGITSLTVNAIQGRNISTTTPSSGNVLSWNGSLWLPSSSGLMPSGSSGQTLRHDGSYWLTSSSVYNDGTNLGINTSNPQQRLHVEGNIRMPATTTTAGTIFQDSIPFLHSYNNNVFLGKYAGNFSLSSNNSIGIGYRSLNGLTSGLQNIGIGYNSLPVNTSGNSNIGIGYQALYSNSTGSANISIGTNSLYHNSTAANNTAIGYQSMYSNSTGTENTAMGSYSMYRNNLGSYNTSVGYYSLASNGSGTYNTSVGYKTLTVSSNSHYNSAFGSEALMFNAAGTGNTAVGRMAMYFNQSGNYNTAIGLEALYSNGSGNYNTALGGYSLMSNANGSNNTGIGLYALSENKTGSKNTAIGEYAAPSTNSGNCNTAVGSYSLLNNQSGDSNTAVGNKSGMLFSAFNNSTAIGNGAIALNPNAIRLGNTAVTYIGGQVGWSTASDGRFKTHVTDYEVGLSFIMKLNPVSYEYSDYGQNGVTYNGFIAQEVERILDENGWNFSGLCKPAHSKDRYSIRYADFVVPLVNAVQEQQLILLKYQEEIEELRNENFALKNNYQSLSAKFADMQKQLSELKKLVNVSN
jgi:hypothetical protein